MDPIKPKAEGYLDSSEEWDSDANSVQQDVQQRERSRSNRPSNVDPGPMISNAPRENQDSLPKIKREGRGSVRGVARSVKMLQHEQSKTLAFRVDRYDNFGNRMEPVAVELPKYKSGQISEGEEVEVKGRWSHGALRARRVTNLTTGVSIRRLPRWVIVPALLVFLAVMGVIGFMWWNAWTGSGFEASMPEAPSSEPPPQVPPQQVQPAAPRPAAPRPAAAQRPPVQRPPAQREVPNVAGQDAFSGFKELASAGFVPREIQQESTTIPAGTVIRTNPPAGKMADEGSVVALYVSKAPEANDADANAGDNQ